MIKFIKSSFIKTLIIILFIFYLPISVNLEKKIFKDYVEFKHEKYKIKKGDTIWSISKKFNVNMSSLMRENNLVTYDIKYGETLRIPKNTNKSENFDQRYKRIVGIVIDKLEGGYYHPDMLKDGRVKDMRYSKSGETMMGIDRKNGNKLNKTKAGKEFWSIIDSENARYKWRWGYRGGKHEDKLRKLAGEIIKPTFLEYCDKYLTDEAKHIIMNDDRLLFNFVYATWNGPGWFKYFSNHINYAVRINITDTDKLVSVCINARIGSKSSIIKRGGYKILKIFKTL
mgnify:CR=1 FL=1